MQVTQESHRNKLKWQDLTLLMQQALLSGSTLKYWLRGSHHINHNYK